MFDSDTDLAPPDLKRFLKYVGETVHAGIAYSSGQDGTARRSQNFSLRAASTKAEVIELAVMLEAPNARVELRGEAQ